MTVAAPWVRGVYELSEPRRIEREDMVYTVRLALRIEGETILDGDGVEGGWGADLVSTGSKSAAAWRFASGWWW